MTKLHRRLALAGVPVALILTLSLGTRVPSVAASNAQSGQLVLQKDCSKASRATPWCQITYSNLREIPYGPLGDPNAAIVVYDQGSNGIGMTDSNVVLYIPAPGAPSSSPGTPSSHNWAVGRCSLNPDQLSGLCRFSDGAGELEGFHALLVVSSTDAVHYNLNGTYSFKQPE